MCGGDYGLRGDERRVAYYVELRNEGCWIEDYVVESKEQVHDVCAAIAEQLGLVPDGNVEDFWWDGNVNGLELSVSSVPVAMGPDDVDVTHWIE